MRHVFGKKKAKEECARLVLLYLEDLRDKREEAKRGLMAGTKGGEAIVGRALGKPATVEGAGGGKMEVEESGSEGFESAPEVMD